MSYVIDGQDAAPQADLGGKAKSLAKLAEADVLVPAWLVLRPDAFLASLPAEYSLTENPETHVLPPHVLARLAMPPDVKAELLVTLERLSPDRAPVAVRSSGLDEDGGRESFAGQLDSFLNVPLTDVIPKIIAVWRSAYSERVLAYRSAHRLAASRPPAVLIQRMVQAEAAGVAFTADPVGGRNDVAVVAAVYGLGTTLVSGDSDADTFHVDRTGQIISHHIANKRIAHRPLPGEGGLQTTRVSDDLIEQPAITNAQVLAVAEMARRVEDHIGAPQDIEWALADGQLYLLQSRAITTLNRLTCVEGPVVLWDNSNISESYGGVTTPLTFSFVRLVYEEVYREFCRLLRVPDERLQVNDHVFRNMLGLVQGRIYYNLLNWYRALALLPGFKANRRFMEQMMGVSEGLPGELVEELSRASRLEKGRDRLYLCRSVVALAWGHFTIRRRVQAFMKRLKEAVAIVPAGQTGQRPHELAQAYRELERRLLKRWDAPLLNDLLAMIFHGVLGKLTRAWCHDSDGRLRNDLLRESRGMVSAEPALLVRHLAEIAAESPSLVSALCRDERPAIESNIQATPEFRRLYEQYLNRFSDRCPGELKLESIPLDQDPLPLLRTVGEIARQLSRGESSPTTAGPGAEQHATAMAKVKKVLRWHPLRAMSFRWVLRCTRARIRDRENLRFERTRLFGKVRRIFSELGLRFYELGVLDDPRDIFYLEANEGWGYLDGTATCTDLKGLVRVRKAAFDAQRSATQPPGRFETTGCVPLSRWRGRFAVACKGEQRQGLGCCPGVVRGPVRIVDDPCAARLHHGEILVAMRTDPGWVILFPTAAGILVERGSLLSHAAVVTRELGIPSVVSVPGLISWLRDGDWVELDGGTGLVTRIAAPASDDGASTPTAGFSHAE